MSNKEVSVLSKHNGKLKCHPMSLLLHQQHGINTAKHEWSRCKWQIWINVFVKQVYLKKFVQLTGCNFYGVEMCIAFFLCWYAQCTEFGFNDQKEKWIQLKSSFVWMGLTSVSTMRLCRRSVTVWVHTTTPTNGLVFTVPCVPWRSTHDPSK